MSKMNLTPINKRKRVMGWVAVALSLAVASFFGMFAGAEGVTEGWPAMLGHSLQTLVLIVPALIAVRWPRVGGSIIVLAGPWFWRNEHRVPHQSYS